MNVLLTRAKKGLVVVGHRETLQTSDLWGRWLDQAPVLKSQDLKAARKESNVVKKPSKQLNKQKKGDPKHKKR